MKMFYYLAFVALIFFSCQKKENPLIGQDAFDFTLKTIDETEFNLIDIKGKTIMLHFWADWCASCREEFYTLQNVFDAIKNEESVVVGINVGQTKEHVKELIDEYDITFTMLRDEDKKIAEKYHVTGLPMNIFIAKSGKIHKVITGWMEKDKILEIFKELEN